MRGLWIAVMFAGALLAGCAEPGTGDERQAAQDTQPTAITDPTDYSYLDDPNDPGAHRHDYWGGKDNLTILDAEGPSRSATCSSSRAGTCQMEVVWARPPDGTVIPQGAAFLDIAFDVALTEQENVDRFVLWVKTAQQAEMQEVGEIVPGQWYRLNSTNDDNDVPHNTLSLWEFEVAAATDADSLSFSGQGSLQVHAVRGLELPLFPSHPDLWGGKDELVLFTAEVSGEERRQPTGWACGGGMCAEYRPDDGMLVPFGASAVEVTVEYTAATPNARVLYSGSDTWDYTPLEPEATDDPLVDVFRIETPLEMTDSPYAKQSLWSFTVDAGELAAGFGYQRGDLTLTATAIR